MIGWSIVVVKKLKNVLSFIEQLLLVLEMELDQRGKVSKHLPKFSSKFGRGTKLEKCGSTKKHKTKVILQKCGILNTDIARTKQARETEYRRAKMYFMSDVLHASRLWRIVSD